MATTGEANDINTVLLHLLNSTWNGCAVPSEYAALDAAKRLAARSHRALMAGLNADDVVRLWPQRLGSTAA